MPATQDSPAPDPTGPAQPPAVPPPAAPPQAIILYCRTAFSRKPEMPALRATLAAAWPGSELHEAYEDQTSPALPEVLDALYARGLRRVTVLPCGLPPDLSLAHWLPGALRAHLGERRDFEILLSPPLEAFLDLAAAASAALQAPPARRVAEAAPSMGKPGWTDVPRHRHQVFFCLGARCAHRGAHQLLQALRRALRDQRALNTGAGRVMCVRSSCLFPCNQGPMMVVHPEGIWYGGLTEPLIGRIVTEHLLGGQPVEAALIHRQQAGETTN